MASVLELVKHYQHSIEKYQNDEQKVLRAINKLFHLEVTVQHLQDTGVGRTVNALRKEPGEVGQAARALVYKWKVMVASEESDHEADQNNDTKNCNGHGNGKDSDDNACRSRSRHNDAPERLSKTVHKSQMNGNTSGSKRKYHSSEDEDNSNKKRKHSSSSENDEPKKSIKVKQEQSESDEHRDSEDSHSSESESEMSDSSEDDRHVIQKIKKEPTENNKSASIKHSSHNHVDQKKEASSSKTPSDSDKHSKSHTLESRKSSYKSSSRERSQSSHKHKSATDKESSSERKHQSEHSDNKGSKREDRNNTSSKHKSSSEKHRSSSEKHSSLPEKHSRSSESQKSSSQRDSKSDKHKEKCDKKENHESKSDKHSSHSHKSDKDKHNSSSKSSSDKEAQKHKSRESSSSTKDKHSSSSKEKSKDRSCGSSKDKSNDSYKSDKKSSSSHESKSKGDSKDKNKDNDKSSEIKSKNKSSSSSSVKSDKSSSRDRVPKIKPQINNSVDSDDGIDCGSGASFAEALGMASPAKTKKKSISLKEMSSPNSFNNDLSPAALLAPTAKLAPLPALEISALPEISPNYRPRPPPRLLPHFTDDEAINAGISSKNQRTKVYSGNKVIGKIPTLYELCVHVLQEHIDALEFTGGVPYEILKPIVDKATPQQLFMLEYHNPYLTEDTDHLWKAFCEKHFRNKKREEMEAWREMYMRCQEEQEDKLKSLTANIKMTQEAKKAPIKQTKMAYVDSVVKPPRNVARKQAQHGTAFASTASPAARVASLASAPNVLRGGSARPIPVPTPGAASFKPKKAPLMAKALQFMRGRKR